MIATNPAWSPDVRRKVEKSLDGVTLEAKDVLMRYTRDGYYVPPSEVGDFGDLNGLIACGESQVLDRLEAKIREARSTIETARREMQDYLATLGQAHSGNLIQPRDE